MGIKSFIKNEFEKRVDSVYEARLSEKRVSYDFWIRLLENSLEQFDMSLDPETVRAGREETSYVTHYEGTTVSIVPFDKVGENFAFKNVIEDVCVFVNGELTARAIPLIVRCFKDNPDCMVIYGDEDIATLDKESSLLYGKSIYGTRKDPFFKPDWSPNSFLDHFYFCNICAVRRVAFRDLEMSPGYSGAKGIYHTLLRYIYEDATRIAGSVIHIDEILVHATGYENNYITDERAPIIAKRLRTDDFKGGFTLENKAKLSVVIPSKDNADMLKKCVTSLYDACPGTIELQTIVVDNGSSTLEKDKIESLVSKYSLVYEYHPMEFNFSRMCNIGASKATGDYLLFLNDDVTFTAPYTLEEMLDKASYCFTGAVGAKLFYPRSSIIQHAGVVNTTIGPVHKLQFKPDWIDHYYGYNHLVNNVLAVTGACLMVRKTLFDSMGGLNEALRVAFNDIDLCFKLYKAGYYNVVCNNISLEHAESISRGKDTDPDSLKRLLAEKSELYKEHPSFKGKDPFYSKYLVNDCLNTAIVPASEYEYRTAVEEPLRIKEIDISKYRKEECIYVSIEFSGDLKDFVFDTDEDAYYVQGFSFITGSNNACYKKSLLLCSSEKTYALPFEGCLREDVAENCPDLKNAEMSGFAIKIPVGALSAGTYNAGLLFEHKFLNEKLYKLSAREITIR
jgi:GT2 family glycosyltransferase